MGAGQESCLGPAGLAVFIGLLLIAVLLAASLVAPEAAVVLFMAVPALVAITVLRKARGRMKRPQ